MSLPETAPASPLAVDRPTAGVEREVKLEADASFHIPDLGDLSAGAKVVPAPEQFLSATYFDTAELQLARARITLRHRTEAEGGKERELWTLKLPADAQGVVLARHEINWPGTIEQIPADVVHLVRAATLGADLRPVARLVTNRRRLELHDAGGTALAEIADDQVDGTRFDGAGDGGAPGEAATLRFRQLEVELLGGAPEVLAEALLDRLTVAGAVPGTKTPKLFRVLGDALLRPPDVTVPELTKKSTAADMVRASIAGAFVALTSHDPGLRLGGDVEHVHKARVATRRLRSDLRTFRSLLDPEWSALTRDELKWAGTALGAARDLDVLYQRFEQQAANLGVVEGPAGGATGSEPEPAREDAPTEENRRGTAQLLERISAARAAAGEALVGVLDSDRYLHLLTTLRDAALNPPLLGADTGARARYVAPALVKSAWKRTRKAARALSDPPADEELHELRKRAKALRYGAEAAAPFVGKPAAKLATRAKALQDVLGELQDAVVARAWLEERAPSMDATEALVAGQLMEHQLVLHDQMRAAWPKAWKNLRRKSLRAWLT